MNKANSFFTKFIKTPFTKEIAKALLDNNEAIITLMSKTNKPYQVRITYSYDNGYTNFEREFVNSTQAPSNNT